MDGTPDASTWRVCSACKKPILWNESYWVCSVSSCNRARAPYVFCRIECWDSHVPVMNHRDAWAEERVAPSRPRPTAATAPLVTRPLGAPTAAEPASRTAAEAPDLDVLVVVSKLKKYVRDKHGLSTSDQVIDVLSDRVRELCDDAAEKSRQAGRKTLMDRDF
jgi:histone H3/H4